jgi:DnaK suppressor protein
VAKKSAKKSTAKTSEKSTAKRVAGKANPPKKAVKKSTGGKSTARKATRKSSAGTNPASKKKTTKKSTANTFSSKKSSSQRKASSNTQAGSENTKSALKADSPLTDKDLKHFRELLVVKRRSLIGDMAGIEGTALGRNQQESSGDLSNMPTHPADIGSDNYEYEFTLGLLESERILLGEINAALERIDNKTFGVCLGTGEPIGRARLEARPWCQYSIEYQRMIEKGLVRPGDDDRYNTDGTLDEDSEDDDFGDDED